MRKVYWVFIISILGMACQEDDKNEVAFDRGAILQNVAENFILSSYSNMQRATDSLLALTRKFVAGPSTSTLSQLQNQWVVAKLAWKQAEVFNFGPMDGLGIETSIDYWPTNSFGIESTLGTDKEIGTKFLLTIPSNQKGLPAIEYLLFSKPGEEVINQFNASQKRKDFLLALTEGLNQLIQSLHSEWAPDGNNYSKTFVGAVGNDVGSSTTMLTNEMIYLLEEIVNVKIGAPSGIKGPGGPKPGLVEMIYANKSKEAILENLTMLEEVFSGGDGIGFDDYLDALHIQEGNETLSKAIKSQFISSKMAVEAIDGPLKDAITSGPEKVKVAYSEVQKLLILIKTDMMSQLGLVVTFSDNDGD